MCGIIRCIDFIIGSPYVKLYRQCLEVCMSEHSDVSDTANQKHSFLGRQIHSLLGNSVTEKDWSLQRT